MLLPALDSVAPPTTRRYDAQRSRRKADLELIRTSIAIVAALDHLNHGVALVDADLRVHYANQQLQRLCHRADGLLMRNGALAATAVSGPLQLNCALARALFGGEEATLRLRRLPPKRPLSILVRPLRLEAASAQAAAPLALLLIGAPDRAALPPATRLRQAYGLTAAEATVAQRLLQGCDIHAVSRLSNVSVATARTHLRSLLAKTETHRQSELMRVLLQELGWMI